MNRLDLNPADPDYQLRKLRAQVTDAYASGPVLPGAGEDVELDPAGWWEEDPDLEGALIYHAPLAVTPDPLNLEVPLSSNFVPDPSLGGGAIVLQAL